MSYTKLSSSILTSTIWTEDANTKLVWITLLVLADKNGEVTATIPGLARMAGVPIPDCEHAVNKFLAPDPYSRTPDDQGRRLEQIEGGWCLLNHQKYRLMAGKDEQRSSNAERQRRWKERQDRNGKSVTGNAKVTLSNAKVTPGNGRVTQGRDIAEAEAEAYTHSPPASPGSCPCTEDEAWRYADGQMIGLGREGVSLWHSDRCANGWMIARGNGAMTPIHDWRADLRRSVPWLTEKLSRAKTAVKRAASVPDAKTITPKYR